MPGDASVSRVNVKCCLSAKRVRQFLCRQLRVEYG